MSLTVDLDLPTHDPKLVVNAVLEAGDDLSKVYVSHSLNPVSLNQFSQIDDAVVVLKENNIIIDELTYQLDPNSDSDSAFYYVTDVVMEENKSYQIELTHPDYPTATAQEIIPSPTIIQSAELGAVSDNVRSLQFSINDPVEVNNYYLLRIKYIGEKGKWNGLWFESNEPAFEGNQAWDQEYDGRKVLFNDQLFDGANKSFSLDVEFWEEMDSIKIILYTASEAYYNYHQSRRLQNQGEGSAILGSEPVVVYNNIENGFGIFASRSKDTFIIASE